MKETVINQLMEPLMLDDGTQIGAAHTSDARREGVVLSEGDRKRLVATGRLRIVERVEAKPEGRETATVSEKNDKRRS